MNNIQLQSQKLDEQLDVQELAHLTLELWKITRPETNATIEGIGNWMKNLVYDEVPVIVKAYEEDNLVGWVLLFVHDSKKLEINPWALGGHLHSCLMNLKDWKLHNSYSKNALIMLYKMITQE